MEKEQIQQVASALKNAYDQWSAQSDKTLTSLSERIEPMLETFSMQDRIAVQNQLFGEMKGFFSDPYSGLVLYLNWKL